MKTFNNRQNMDRFFKIFGKLKPITIGMIHVKALPGTPTSNMSLKEITKLACEEAVIYRENGVDALMVENMHDRPWLMPHQMGPETTAFMTAVCSSIKYAVPKIPVGVQVLSAANTQALAVAKAAELDFIRAEGFVFSHIGDEGFINSCAAELLRYRKQIDAEHISVFTDVKKKHSSHSITSDVDIAETAVAAELFLSDGIIVTGSSTGQPTSTDDLNDVLNAVSLPVLIGSGITTDNMEDYLQAHAFIVGSHFKKNGQWDQSLDPQKVEIFMNKLHSIR